MRGEGGCLQFISSDAKRKSPADTHHQEKNMTTATRQTVLQPQVSATLRFAAAVGVCAVLAFAWTVAEHASHQAVDTATAAFSNGPAHATPAAVEVAGRRVASARRS
jgi:hypothetical protein